MSTKAKESLNKDDAIQAIVIADTFGDEFVPISDDIPLALLPVLNRPLIDYTLEFLSLGGIEETFLFCCSHVDTIKKHISDSIEQKAEWSMTMKVNVLVSESCHSFGDCLRDLDQKALVRGNFVLVEPGTISNIKLIPLLKKHLEITKRDKGAAATLIFQEAGLGQIGRNPSEDIVIAKNDSNRVLFHNNRNQAGERKVTFPLEIFLDNAHVSLHHNLKDAHITICSPSFLPLFSDNFDFQTKEDFIKGLLVDEEILDSRVYLQIVRDEGYGGAVNSWRMYQALTRELTRGWIYPLQMPKNKNRLLKTNVISLNTSVQLTDNISHSVIGEKVTLGKGATIENSVILSNCQIDQNVTITNSIIGPNCVIKANSKITAGSILGKGVALEKSAFIENSLVQSQRPEHCEAKDQLGSHAFRLQMTDDHDDQLGESLARKMSRLHIDQDNCKGGQSDQSDGFSDSDDDDYDGDDDDVSYDDQSPVPDDTKMFFNEVLDSLTRGFEDELHCDNLILEVNSSRYAYNVTVKEVNFNVIRAILQMSLKLPTGAQYFSQFVRLLSYFSPLLKNYVKNESAMLDTLQALEDVAINNDGISDKWVIFVLKWFYEKEFVTEEVILSWCKDLDSKSNFHSQVRPFTDWLQEAEEATSSEDESD